MTTKILLLLLLFIPGACNNIPEGINSIPYEVKSFSLDRLDPWWSSSFTENDLEEMSQELEEGIIELCEELNYDSILCDDYYVEPYWVKYLPKENI